ncbi:hypothetical protein Tco_0321993 [Tanacetum coccineum]
MPRIDVIDISSNESSPIQNNPPNTTIDTTLALSLPSPITSQAILTQWIEVSPLAPRALVFSTLPSSCLEPHPYLNSLEELPPRSSNPPPPSSSPGFSQTLPQQTPMDFEPSFPLTNLSRSRLSTQPEPFLSRDQVETFVPQVELSVEQKYFSSVSTTSETSSNESTSSSPPTTIPNTSKLMKHFHKMETEFEKLFTLLEKASTLKSIFYTSREDILLNEFCCKEVKPILNELHSFFKFLLKQFPEEVKTMMDVFESMESVLDTTWKQNEILNNQLLEATLKHDVKKCLLMCNDFVNVTSLDEFEKVKRKSIDVQENLHKRIKILKYDEKLENENVPLEFQVQSLIKERENIKLHYQNLFDSIKKTQTQSQKEVNELIENVNQKTYAYGDNHSEDVEVRVRTNKNTNVASKKDVVENKKIVRNVDVKNSLKAKDVSCVSYDKNVLTPCHDKCLAKYKLNVHSKVRRALFTTPRTAKPISLDTTSIVTKTRFAVVTPLSAKNKDSTAFRSTSIFAKEISLSKYIKTKIKPNREWKKWYETQPNVGWSPKSLTANAKPSVVKSRDHAVSYSNTGCSKYMTGNLKLLKNFVEKLMGTVRFGNDHFAAITGYGDYVHGNITIFHICYVEGLGHNLFSVGQLCDSDLEVAFRSKTCYV